MLHKLEDCLQKSCLIGLSYFDAHESLLKQNLLAGVVISVDSKLGITCELMNHHSDKLKNKDQKATFIVPANLDCWFVAPQGEFHTSKPGVKIVNPDYLVTWDIYQTKTDKNDGEQQWWEWRPRINSPVVS